jgi:hypothetical protein
MPDYGHEPLFGASVTPRTARAFEVVGPAQLNGAGLTEG